MSCPASVLLGTEISKFEIVPESDESFANEGTLAHLFAELEAKRMAGYVTPDEYNIGLLERQANRLYSREMLEHAATYVEVLRGVLNEAQANMEEPTIFFEQPVQADVKGVLVSGTADCIVYTKSKLYIIDYKYGVGIPVDVVDNKQLLTYATLYCAELEDSNLPKEVELHVVQPRIANVAKATYPIDKVASHYKAILQAVNSILLAEAKVKYGDHCRYCPAKAMCPAYYELVREKYDLSLVPNLMTNEQVLDILNTGDLVIKWVKEVQSFARLRAIDGYNWDGYKVVESIRRRTIPEENVEAVSSMLLMSGYKGHEVFETSLLPITKLEKVLGKKVFNDIVGPFVKLSAANYSLVDIKDKRSSAKPTKPGDEF